jgi:hypothetical protein
MSLPQALLRLLAEPLTPRAVLAMISRSTAVWALAAERAQQWSRSRLGTVCRVEFSTSARGASFSLLAVVAVVAVARPPVHGTGVGEGYASAVSVGLACPAVCNR